MTRSIEFTRLIDEWDKEQYLDILIYQTPELSKAMVNLWNKQDKFNGLCSTHIIGALKMINDVIIDKYGVEYYLIGLNELCSRLNSKPIEKDNLIVKKGWMRERNRKKIFFIL